MTGDSMFPKFTGHGHCPKCGVVLQTYWHEFGFGDWGAPHIDQPGPCHEAEGWPQVDGGALDPIDKADEEHLHRYCKGCTYQRIESLATPDQRSPVQVRYEYAYGMVAINEKAARGWRVVAAFMATDIIALMEVP
jgi:hypothetical protein